MRKFQNLGPCEKTCDSNKPVKITLSKNLWQSLIKLPKNTSEKPCEKTLEQILRKLLKKHLWKTIWKHLWTKNEMKWNEKNEIDNRNLQRHTANNEGINNVLYLYNYLTCL